VWRGPILRGRVASKTLIGAGLSVLLLTAVPDVRGQTPADVPPIPPSTFTVDVIGATPLPGVDLLPVEIAAPVQTAGEKEIESSGALDLADFLNRRFSGVHVNEVQGNPFQIDVNYRGYTASPLLGTPQGLSVFLDGVRLNQPFGDVVSWDLIPRIAIASTTLVPGSNPLFGLNTLGGALSLESKSGRTSPGTSAEVTYSSNARRSIELEHGGRSANGIDWYLAGNLFAEDGWREHSPSDVRQLFARLGWKGVSTDVSLSAAWADNALTGNGLQDLRLLARDNASVYTSADTTQNRGTLFNLSVRHRLTGALSFSGNAYYRDIRTGTLNPDINEASLGQSLYQPTAAERAALAAAGFTGVPAGGETAANTPFPFWRCIADSLLRDHPAETCNGLLNTTDTLQKNGGAAGQATLIANEHGRRHQLTAGAAVDGSSVAFTQATQLGFLNPDRTVTGVGAFGDGVTGGTLDDAPFDTRVNLDGRNQTLSIYATDTATIAEAWHVTVSGRFNRTTIRNRDLIRPGGGEGSLDGRHAYARFNPAAGVTFSPTPSVNLYAGYSEGNRAPTSVELGCADPSQPCRLPNAMAGDPPLDRVVARTFETGVRGGLVPGRRIAWNAGLFIAENRQDILFVASAQSGSGYFKNFGVTRREGIELGANRPAGRLLLGAGYTLLSATYESGETVGGDGNSTNDRAVSGARGLEGTIDIKPGDRIPMIPRQTLKAYADLEVTEAMSLDLDLVVSSSIYARGNENNQHQPDGTIYLGPGTAPGYGVVNLGTHWRLSRRLQIVGQVSNLFDRRYVTAAQLGPSGLTGAGTFIARPFPAVNGEFPVQQATFYTPGAPRLFWIGTQFRF
jgi:outer membrane receptor protein involved in Fe transport